jgi:hypothetical protein
MHIKVLCVNWTALEFFNVGPIHARLHIDHSFGIITNEMVTESETLLRNCQKEPNHCCRKMKFFYPKKQSKTP